MAFIQAEDDNNGYSSGHTGISYMIVKIKIIDG